MAKIFPKLTQTHVRIVAANGKSIMVPMLPVGKLQELNNISERLSKAKDVAEITAVRAEMIQLAMSVMPEEIRPNLERFRIDQLAELLAYLMYGDDDDQEMTTEKK